MNKSLSINLTTVRTGCPLAASAITYNYVLPVISALGIVVNLFSSIVFYLMNKNIKLPGQMFKYFFLKSVNDMLQFVFQIFSPVYYCDGCTEKTTYGGAVWYIAFFYYAECVVELCSSWLEVFATLDCLVIITKKFRFINTKTFCYTASILIHVYALVYYLFWFFSLSIEKDIDSDYFIVKTTEFYTTKLVVIMRYIHTIQRDLIVFILLLLLNILIFIQFKSNTTRKVKLLNVKNKIQKTTHVSFSVGDMTTNQTVERNKYRSAEKAERNNRNMIVLVAINYFIGHFGSILYYIPFPASAEFWSCFYDLDLTPFYLSYIIHNVFYFIYNKHFYKYTMEIIRFLISPFSKCSN
jgi:hypothetical protein